MSWHVAILSLCVHIQCVSHSIFSSGQHFTLSFSSYSSHAAVVPTRLLIAHPLVPALGTYTRWRCSILFWYTGWRWSILYWYTGWRWSILLVYRMAVVHSVLVYTMAVSTGVQDGGGAFSTGIQDGSGAFSTPET